MSKNVFVYGSLMFPAIANTAAGISSPRIPATLQGFARYTVNSRERAKVPGIIKQPGASVEGFVYRDITTVSMERLDRFEEVESDLYQRISVSVILSDGIQIESETYLAGPRIVHLLSGIWDPTAFEEQELEYYLIAVVRPFADSLDL